MIIRVIGTGSQGNCYYVERSGMALIIEAGISYDTVTRVLGEDIKKVVGVLVTHEHGDHIKYVQDFINRGYEVYMSNGTATGAGIPQYMVNVIQAKQPFFLKDFHIMPFELEHDVLEPTGFMIDIEDKRLVFATDTYYIKYKFPNVTHYIVECNHDMETMLSSGDNKYLVSRIMESHMSLETLVKYFKASDLSKVEEIHLIHASSRNGNRNLIADTIKRHTGKYVVVH